MTANSSSNLQFPNKTLNVSWGPVQGQHLKTISYCIFFVMSLFGNGYIIWAIKIDRRLHNTTNFLVSSMAVSDVLATLFVVPLKIVQINFNNEWLVGGNFGNILCKIVAFSCDVSPCVSLQSCLFIAIDRYYAFKSPFKRNANMLSLKYIISGIWIGTCLLLSPYMYYCKLKQLKLSGNQTVQLCLNYGEFPKSYSYSLITVYVIIPVLATSALYFFIACRLRINVQPGNASDAARLRRELQNRKALKMCVAIVVLLFISWIYVTTILIMMKEGRLGGLDKSMSTNNARFVAYFFVHLSFCYNFFIYLKFNNIFLELFKSTVLKYIVVRKCRGKVQIIN